jgi:hypothetical protein
VEDLVPGAHQRELFLALAQQWAFGNSSYRVLILWNRRSVRPRLLPTRAHLQVRFRGGPSRRMLSWLVAVPRQLR